MTAKWTVEDGAYFRLLRRKDRAIDYRYELLDPSLSLLVRIVMVRRHRGYTYTGCLYF
jgi:hypothetical protein